MDQDSTYMVAASKVPMLKPGEFELWRMRIEQYIQMIDYALWEVIENGATLPKTQVVEGVTTVMPITSAEDKAQRRLEVKARRLAELHERDTQDLYALLEDAQDGRSRISQRVEMNSQRVDLLMGDRMTLQETVWMVEEEAYASREAWAHSIGLSQATHQELQKSHVINVYAHVTYLLALPQTELAALRETDRRRQDQMVETLRVIRDMRREMSDMQAELLALREQRGRWTVEDRD
ncbi:hypothetical protein Tco_1311618 [Tanacetum coccineum]